jgi:FKBP-type peptidyl-prolyl cis-trans isomerase FklB
LNRVIAGWTEGLQLMKEGATYRFFIPYNLAYGENGAGELIAPFSALVFDVELLEVL